MGIPFRDNSVFITTLIVAIWNRQLLLSFDYSCWEPMRIKPLFYNYFFWFAAIIDWGCNVPYIVWKGHGESAHANVAMVWFLAFCTRSSGDHGTALAVQKSPVIVVFFCVFFCDTPSCSEPRFFLSRRVLLVFSRNTVASERNPSFMPRTASLNNWRPDAPEVYISYIWSWAYCKK